MRNVLFVSPTGTTTSMRFDFGNFDRVLRMSHSS